MHLLASEVGIGSAVISLCSTAALLTYLGSSAILIERLPATRIFLSVDRHPGPSVFGHGRGNRLGDRRRRAGAADFPALPLVLHFCNADTRRSSWRRGMDAGEPSWRGVHCSPPGGAVAIDPNPGQRGQAAPRHSARGRWRRRDGPSGGVGCERRTRRLRRSRLARTADGPRPSAWPSPASARGSCA